MSLSKKILIITDNLFILEHFKRIMKDINVDTVYRCSPNSPLKKILDTLIIKDNVLSILDDYNLIFSAHCKQLFPKEIVSEIRCINIHPGLNPYNRGWFPQIFSIINNLPLGATIHEMDEELDHGAIICQKEVALESWDTSLSAYEKVQKAEIELLEKWLPKIISGNYNKIMPLSEGNINLKKDFNALCEIDLNKIQKIGDTIDLLRALSHGEYYNAYFKDSKTNEKIYVRVKLTNYKK
jgi:methionyl-tRNA formyltransferase